MRRRDRGAHLRSFLQESEGRAVISDLNAPAARPATAKPTATDTRELRAMIKELSDELAAKRAEASQLSIEIDEFSRLEKVSISCAASTRNEN